MNKVFGFLLTLAVISGSIVSLSAQDLNSAAAASRGELEQAQAEYRELLESIAEEKIPLTRDIDILDNEVVRLSQEYRTLLREKRNREVGEVNLRRTVDAMLVAANFTSQLLLDFSRSYLNRLHTSEWQHYEPMVREVNAKVQSGTLNRTEEYQERLRVLESSIGRLEQAMGGEIFESSVLSPSGDELQGKVALIGPSGFFASSDGNEAGLINPVTEVNVKPTLIPTIGSDAARKLVQGQEAVVPMDPSLGKATKIQESRDSILEHVQKGGLVGYCIIGLGAFALAITLFKWIEISRFAIPRPEQINSILADLLENDEEKAEKDAREIPGDAGEMMVIGVKNFHLKRRVLEELLYEKLLTIRPKLERYLPFLAVTAAAAPLMGLLGTVMGMIKTFKIITDFGTGDAKSLSSGISEALVTTELGLIVAIPILILHGMMSRMARGRVGRMESAAMAFLNGVSAKEIRKAAAA